jgi:hypothetical protein
VRSDPPVDRRAVSNSDGRQRATPIIYSHRHAKGQLRGGPDHALNCRVVSAVER